MLKVWHSIRVRSLVLLAYLLVIGAGLIAPSMAAGDIQVICLGNGGMKMVVIGDDGSAEPLAAESTMVCPLCQTSAPPPVVVTPSVPALSPLAHALTPAVAAHLVAITGAPLPPRGPPHA